MAWPPTVSIAHGTQLAASATAKRLMWRGRAPRPGKNPGRRQEAHGEPRQSQRHDRLAQIEAGHGLRLHRDFTAGLVDEAHEPAREQRVQEGRNVAGQVSASTS